MRSTQSDGLNVTEDGNAAARLESGISGVACLEDVDTAGDTVEVVLDDKNAVILNGTFDGFAFHDVAPDSEETTDGAYDGSPSEVSVDHSDPSGGTEVTAIDANDDSDDDEGEATDDPPLKRPSCFKLIL